MTGPSLPSPVSLLRQVRQVSLLRQVRQVRQVRQEHRECDGFTLVELIVSMTLLTIVMAIVFGAILSLQNAVNKQTGYVSTQFGARSVFQTIDDQVRYADAITTPGTVNGNQYVEWEVLDPTIVPTTGQSHKRCYQWKASASAGTLQYRSWIEPITNVSATPTGWHLVATGLVIGTQPVFTTAPASLEQAPFSVPSPTASAAVGVPQTQQLGVSVTLSQAKPSASAATTTLFSALDSSTAGVGSTVCSTTQVPRS